MEIFLLRHFESIKNTQIRFSSDSDNESLTENGVAQGKSISKNISQVLDLLGINVKNIYCAQSVRARQTATLIADALSNSVEIQEFKELLSTKSSELVGKTKEEIWKTDSQLSIELSLYDAGLYSAYDFHRSVGRDKKKDYEQQVCKCMEMIIDNGLDEEAKIICLHSSSLTAAVIGYARDLCQYPNNYYGKVNADYGKIFWLHFGKNEKYFLAANSDSSDILRVLRSRICNS